MKNTGLVGEVVGDDSTRRQLSEDQAALVDMIRILQRFDGETQERLLRAIAAFCGKAVA